MNKKILILMIPIILFAITIFAKENTQVEDKITKTIETTEDKEQQTLDSINETIEYLGEKYVLSDVKKEKVNSLTKEIQETKKLELSTNNKAEVLSNFPKSIVYDDEYYGELHRISDSLKISPVYHGTYEKVFTVQKQYTNLENNDLANIPKEILQNGTVYVLTNCRWIITENNSISTPTKYTADTIYSGVKKMEYPYTYICSVEYKGTVSQKEYNDLKYILTYVKDTNNEKTPILPLLGSTGVFIIVLFLVFPNAKIKNYYKGNYKTLKSIRVSLKEPVINLRNLPAANSNVFLIEFNKHISKKLQGKFVEITTSKGTIKKMIINNCIEVNL